MADRVEWVLPNGKKIKPNQIKAEIVDAYSETLYESISAIQADVADLIDRLNRRSTKRGLGFLAVNYNRPFDGAEVDVKEVKPGEVYRIFVIDGPPRSPGYKFNRLDAGIPARAADTHDVMVFPVYDGHLTKSEGDTFTLNKTKVKIGKPVRWMRVEKVEGAPARNFLESIVRRSSLKNRGQTRPAQFRGVLREYIHQDAGGAISITTRRVGGISDFAFRVDPSDVSLKVVKK